MTITYEQIIKDINKQKIVDIQKHIAHEGFCEILMHDIFTNFNKSNKGE